MKNRKVMQVLVFCTILFSVCSVYSMRRSFSTSSLDGFKNNKLAVWKKSFETKQQSSLHKSFCHLFSAAHITCLGLATRLFSEKLELGKLGKFVGNGLIVGGPIFYVSAETANIFKKTCHAVAFVISRLLNKASSVSSKVRMDINELKKIVKEVSDNFVKTLKKEGGPYDIARDAKIVTENIQKTVELTVELIEKTNNLCIGNISDCLCLGLPKIVDNYRETNKKALLSMQEQQWDKEAQWNNIGNFLKENESDMFKQRHWKEKYRKSLESAKKRLQEEKIVLETKKDKTKKENSRLCTLKEIINGKEDSYANLSTWNFLKKIMYHTSKKMDKKIKNFFLQGNAFPFPNTHSELPGENLSSSQNKTKKKKKE